jgi:hypothetical protein
LIIITAEVTNAGDNTYVAVKIPLSGHPSRRIKYSDKANWKFGDPNEQDYWNLDLPAEESGNNLHQPRFLACLSSFVSKVADPAGSATTPTDKNSEEIKGAEATEPAGSART